MSVVRVFTDKRNIITFMLLFDPNPDTSITFKLRLRKTNKMHISELAITILFIYLNQPQSIK